jgi:hypothetical protein
MISNRALKLFSLCSFIFCAQVDGQIRSSIVTGMVLDSITRQPLPNTSVSIVGEQNSTMTNSKGGFSLHKAGNSSFQLRVEYIGYMPFQTRVLAYTGTQIAVDPILLSLEKRPLRAVTVKATKPLIVQTLNSIILNVSESIVAVGSNAFDILLNAPGVYADQNGSIQVQGRSSVVYIDGRLSNFNGQELKTMLSNMPSSSIDKIEVITNPSAKYDASGGVVINIRTNKNRNYGTNGNLTGFAGAGRYFRGGLGINLNNRTRYVNVYGSYDYQHNVQYFDNESFRYIGASQAISENEYDVRYRNNHSYKLGVDVDVSKRTTIGILARGFVNFRDRNVENISSKQTAGQPDSFSTVHTNGYARFNSPSVNLYFKTQLDSAGSELSINADYFYYQKQWADDFITDYNTKTQNGYYPTTQLRDFSPADNTVKSISADYSRSINKWRMEAGLKGVQSKTDNDIVWQSYSGKWETDPTKTNRFVYKEGILAGYLTFSGKIKKLTLTAGIRVEQTFRSGESVTLNQKNESSYVNLFPNLGVQFSKSTTSQFRAGYRKNIVRYGYDLVNPFIVYQSQYSYSQGNPALKPQINHTVDFAWSYKNKLNTTLSYTHGIGALAPVYKQNPNDHQLISSYDNLAATDIISLNLSSTKSIKKWTSTNTLGVYYMKYTFDKTTGVTANDNMAASIFANSYNTIALPKGLTTEIVMSYRSPVASGIFKSGSYFITNIGLSKLLAKGDGSLKLAVSDLFNTQRTVNKVQGYQGVTGDFKNKPESRFVTLSFSWRFGKKVVKASRNRRTGIEEERGRMGGN